MLRVSLCSSRLNTVQRPRAAAGEWVQGKRSGDERLKFGRRERLVDDDVAHGAGDAEWGRKGGRGRRGRNGGSDDNRSAFRKIEQVSDDGIRLVGVLDAAR